MKYAKELKVGIVVIISVFVLLLGINFLKGINLLGSDVEYHSYFPNSGMLSVSNNVTLNGVVVGKVKNIVYVPKNSTDRRVKITFSIVNNDVLLPKGTIIEIGSLDLFSKGILIMIPLDISKGNYKPSSTIPGRVSVDILSQVKSYADPISQKLQGMMVSIDKMINSLSSFWDVTATSEIEQSLKQVKLTIQKMGNVADEIQGFVASEKNQFSKIMSNIEGISENIRKSNEEVSAIISNSKQITDALVTADFTTVISSANTTLQKFNLVLEGVENGEGTMGKLLKDEDLYNELEETNNKLQILVSDIQVHPERYIHFSVLGRKAKGVPLNSTDEKKLRELLDSIPE